MVVGPRWMPGDMPRHIGVVGWPPKALGLRSMCTGSGLSRFFQKNSFGLEGLFSSLKIDSAARRSLGSLDNRCYTGRRPSWNENPLQKAE